MPSRNRILVVSGGPQGEDAQITVLVPTLGEMREQAKASKISGLDSDDAEISAREYLGRHILSWNWVDDDGNLMPAPNKNPDVFSLLTRAEVTFIGQSLSGMAGDALENQKKLPKPS